MGADSPLWRQHLAFDVHTAIRLLDAPAQTLPILVVEVQALAQPPHLLARRLHLLLERQDAAGCVLQLRGRVLQLGRGTGQLFGVIVDLVYRPLLPGRDRHLVKGTQHAQGHPRARTARAQVLGAEEAAAWREPPGLVRGIVRGRGEELGLGRLQPRRRRVAHALAHADAVVELRGVLLRSLQALLELSYPVVALHNISV
mmetsp:Transcript_9910/g.29259  ORF Transcript_9910/g.29259 Transcript_9910/m.29259 type:complete len:200 (-) Transcript_9910:1158-1757(-)